MRADDVHSTASLRHGAYLCLTVPAGARRAAAAAVPALARRLGLRNEFEPGDDHPLDAIAFLRRLDATPAAGFPPAGRADGAHDLAGGGDLPDHEIAGAGAQHLAGGAGLPDHQILSADAVVHVASASADLVTELCAEATRLLAPACRPLVLRGVVRPTVYTGNAMHNFAYAHRVLQQPGTVAPHAFLLPTSKSADWWQKDWMERHTYFLPRHDDAGRRIAEGHALAAEAGIACLMRRTYKNEAEPAPPGAYDFLNYFECADADVATFHQVCAALRDVARNPEWRFVREGPTWHGRRFATWEELFD